MGYENLLLLPLVLFSGMFMIRHAEKIRWKVTFLVFMIGFFLVFFFVYPSPVAVDTYAKRIYWRGPTNNLDVNASMARVKGKVLNAVGIQTVEKTKWAYDEEFVEFAERDRKRHEEEGK